MRLGAQNQVLPYWPRPWFWFKVKTALKTSSVIGRFNMASLVEEHSLRYVSEFFSKTLKIFSKQKSIKNNKFANYTKIE